MTLQESVVGLAHVGIRVHDFARSRAFYELLGFRLAWGPFETEPVAGMIHPSGLEINLIVNAAEGASPNVLMDVSTKHAGFTHIALKISDLAATEAALGPAGISITGRRGQTPVNALFVRDPDGNVIELAAD